MFGITWDDDEDDDGLIDCFSLACLSAFYVLCNMLMLWLFNVSKDMYIDFVK